MTKDPEILERADCFTRETENEEAGEVVTGLLSAYRKLEQRYLYLWHRGHPDPDPQDAPASSPEGLAAHWRQEAKALRAHGADALAKICEKHATELEATRTWDPLDTVTLEEASEIGGYSYSQLQHLVSEGKIPNAGRKGAPRIYVRDVPQKPGYRRDKQTASSRRELIEAIK
jgi:hypothetical protein